MLSPEQEKQIQMYLDFREFLKYLDSHVNSNVDIGYYLLEFLNVYYKGKEIENFDANEIYQLMNTLKNYQGENIVTENRIKYVSLAIDFARSNNLNKRENRLCKFSQEYSWHDDETTIDVITKLEVNCISKKYLESIDLYDEQSYRNYLCEKCDNILEEHLLECKKENYGITYDVEF